jgi:hypothetical protein
MPPQFGSSTGLAPAVRAAAAPRASCSARILSWPVRVAAVYVRPISIRRTAAQMSRFDWHVCRGRRARHQCGRVGASRDDLLRAAPPRASLGAVICKRSLPPTLMGSGKLGTLRLVIDYLILQRRQRNFFSSRRGPRWPSIIQVDLMQRHCEARVQQLNS